MIYTISELSSMLNRLGFENETTVENINVDEIKKKSDFEKRLLAFLSIKDP